MITDVPNKVSKLRAFRDVIDVVFCVHRAHIRNARLLQRDALVTHARAARDAVRSHTTVPGVGSTTTSTASDHAVLEPGAELLAEETVNDRVDTTVGRSAPLVDRDYDLGQPGEL